MNEIEDGKERERAEETDEQPETSRNEANGRKKKGKKGGGGQMERGGAETDRQAENRN